MKVEVIVDGKVLPLNGFTQEIIGNVSAGMAESLRGTGPDWVEIVIRVDKSR